MNDMDSKGWFLDRVLSDWEYKEVYVNGKCVYSVESDTEVTLSAVKERLETLSSIGVVSWKQVTITPYINKKGIDDGVIIKFEFGVSFW